MNLWRACCAERRTAGSEGGLRKRTYRKVGTAPQSDPYSVEADAVVLTAWQPMVIPGLLQTEDYARAFQLPAEAVAARMARQVIVTRDDPAPTTLVVLLSEAVLYHLMGSRKIMKEQLEHLLVMSELPNVTIQIVPNDDGRAAGNGGAFTVASMEDRSEVAYLETEIRGITTDDDRDLSALARSLRILRSKALPENQSRDRIRKAIQDKWT